MADSRPPFNVRPAVTIIEVDGIVYNASPVGSNTWHQVREGDYGEGFKQGVFGQNFNLLHNGYVNKDSEDEQIRKHANGVVSTARNNGVIGRTALYGGDQDRELIFIQDEPKVKDGRIVMSQKALEARLGSRRRKIGNVIFSDDGLVRAIPRADVREGEYGAEQMRKLSYPIFMTGDADAPEKMVDIMKIAGKSGYLCVPYPNSIRVPGLSEGGGGVFLVGSFTGEFVVGWCSFGVRQQ